MSVLWPGAFCSRASSCTRPEFKVTNYATSMRYTQSFGFPGELLPLAIVLETVAGLLVLFGLSYPLRRHWSLAGFCIVTAVRVPHQVRRHQSAPAFREGSCDCRRFLYCCAWRRSGQPAAVAEKPGDRVSAGMSTKVIIGTREDRLDDAVTGRSISEALPGGTRPCRLREQSAAGLGAQATRAIWQSDDDRVRFRKCRAAVSLRCLFAGPLDHRQPRGCRGRRAGGVAARVPLHQGYCEELRANLAAHDRAQHRLYVAAQEPLRRLSASRISRRSSARTPSRPIRRPRRRRQS